MTKYAQIREGLIQELGYEPTDDQINERVAEYYEDKWEFERDCRDYEP